MRVKRAVIPVSLLTVILFSLTLGCAQDTSGMDETRESIRQQLIGYELTYSNIAGMPMTEIVVAGNIDSIELTYYEDEIAWIAVLKDGLWYVYFDEAGSMVLDVQQNFVS